MDEMLKKILLKGVAFTPYGDLVDVVLEGQWPSGLYRIQLYEADGPMAGAPYAIATTNIDWYEPPPEGEDGARYVLVKDQDENRGMVGWLVENGVVDITGRAFESGHVLLHECRINDDSLREYRVPCSWEMSGEVKIMASSMGDATKQAYSGTVGLPAGEYVSDSFYVDEDFENPPLEVVRRV